MEIAVTIDKGRIDLIVDGAKLTKQLQGQATAVNSNSGLHFLVMPQQMLALQRKQLRRTYPSFVGCVKAIIVNGNRLLSNPVNRMSTTTSRSQIQNRNFPSLNHDSDNPQRSSTTEIALSARQSSSETNQQKFNLSISIAGPTFDKMKLRRQTSSARSEGSMEKAPIVTAFSENHFTEALDLIGSIQEHMPNKRIIVYDLGLGLASRNVVSII